jgi:hypothetical protein
MLFIRLSENQENFKFGQLSLKRSPGSPDRGICLKRYSGCPDTVVIVFRSNICRYIDYPDWDSIVGIPDTPRIILVYYLKTIYDLPFQAGSFFTVMFQVIVFLNKRITHMVSTTQGCQHVALHISEDLIIRSFFRLLKNSLSDFSRPS